MENPSKSSNSNKPLLAWSWLFVSLWLTSLFLKVLDIPPISLNDGSCSSSTIQECNVKAIENAEGAIKKNLPISLKELTKTREAFSLLKVFPANYMLSIKDMGSESQWKISNPSETFSSGEIDLKCRVSSKEITLKNRQQIKLATIRFTGNVENDVNNTIASFKEFEGCTYLLKEQEQTFNFPPDTIVAPNAIVSLNMLMKPYLNFEVGPGVKASLFLAIFALIGGFLALIKQFLNIAKKGISYFDNDC